MTALTLYRLPLLMAYTADLFPMRHSLTARQFHVFHKNRLLILPPAANISGEKFYARTDGCNFPYNKRIEGAIDGLYARTSVAKRLQQANLFLKKHDRDLELYVLDAYRSLQCQHGLWDFFSAAYRREHPHASQADVDAFTLTYVSDPRGFNPGKPETHPLHSTGGAIDLTLRRCSTGEIIDMGTPFPDDRARRNSQYAFS